MKIPYHAFINHKILFTLHNRTNEDFRLRHSTDSKIDFTCPAGKSVCIPEIQASELFTDMLALSCGNSMVEFNLIQGGQGDSNKISPLAMCPIVMDTIEGYIPAVSNDNFAVFSAVSTNYIYSSAATTKCVHVYGATASVKESYISMVVQYKQNYSFYNSKGYPAKLPPPSKKSDKILVAQCKLEVVQQQSSTMFITGWSIVNKADLLAAGVSQSILDKITNKAATDHFIYSSRTTPQVGDTCNYFIDDFK